MTENKAIDDLLRKRVIVENLWPGCTFNVGDILIADGDLYWPIGDTSWGGRIRKQDVEPFPYLMRPLEWHQERDKNDMPQYVKWTNPSDKQIHFFKVEQWLSNSAGVYTAHIYDPAAYLFIKDIQPATEAEYLNQKQQGHE